MGRGRDFYYLKYTGVGSPQDCRPPPASQWGPIVKLPTNCIEYIYRRRGNPNEPFYVRDHRMVASLLFLFIGRGASIILCELERFPAKIGNRCCQMVLFYNRSYPSHGYEVIAVVRSLRISRL